MTHGSGLPSRATFALCLRPVFRRGLALSAPLLGMAALAVAARPPLADPTAAALWLHLPAFLEAVVCTATVVDAWPPFLREHPARPWVERWRPGPLAGCLAAGAAALVGLLGVLAICACGFEAALGLTGVERPAPRVVLRPLAHRAAVLDERRPRLRVLSGTEEPVRRVGLSPAASLPPGGSLRAARLRVLADGRPVHPGWLEVSTSFESVVVDAGDRTFRVLEIERAPDRGLVLWFAPDSIHVELTRTRSRLLNAILAAGGYAAPVAFVLACLALLRGLLSRTVAVNTAVVLLAGIALADLAPCTPWVAAYAAGRWAPAEPAGAATMPMLAATGALLALAGARGRRRRRG